MVGDIWGMLIKGMAIKNKSANSRLPTNKALLEFSRRKSRIDGETGTWEFGRARTDALIVFMFLLRASDLAALEFRDVTSGITKGRGTSSYLYGNPKPNKR